MSPGEEIAMAVTERIIFQPYTAGRGDRLLPGEAVLCRTVDNAGTCHHLLSSRNWLFCRACRPSINVRYSAARIFVQNPLFSCRNASFAQSRRQLRRYAPTGDRSLGISADPEFDGWRANMRLLEQLERDNRVYSVPSRSRLDRAG